MSKRPPETTAIFIKSERFHDVSTADWYPFLPTPGKYEHPKFGDVIIDNARNQKMVDSVTSQVYQEKIPLDLEHDLKVSGAVGWITNARMNSDGSADAFIEWTDRGQEVLKGSRFRYISPEWFRQWKDPATGQEHQEVVVGGALTTRPFFKDKVLRALVASERGVEVVGRETTRKGKAQKFASETETAAPEDQEVEEEDEEVEEEAPEVAEDTSEDDAPGEGDDEDEESTEEEFTEMSEGFSELQASAIESYVEQQIQAATQTFAEQLQTEKTRGDRAESALKVLTSERQLERFTEVVRNRDAGAPFVGGIDKQVKVLTTLAETFGEDSEEFRDYVETQKSVAAVVKTSEAFSEIGSSAGGGDNAPVARLEAMAEELRKTKPDLTKEQAFSEVTKTAEGARLYAESLSR